MPATVTPGFDRWLDDRSRNDSASAANDAGDAACDAAGPLNTSLDPENFDPEAAAKANADPNSASRFLTYHPFAKQRDFHKSPAKYRLFGGAAGPGKSMALLMEAIVQANDNMGSNTLLLRRTFPELEQSLLLYFRKEIPRELYASFNDSKHVVTWLNGSTTRFGYCAAENDVYQYQGAEFLFIGIDELTLFTLRQWQFLTSRNRCPIARTFPNMAGATNPGNIGHAWVKSLWIDKQPAAGMENPECYDPADYDFISARVHDNPIYAADANYLKTLAALPSHLRRAFLDGDWEVFAGQYFDNFDVTRHIARAEQIEWKPWWPRWISIDWGFEHPSATYWHAAAPGTAAPSSSTGPAGRRERENAACAAVTPPQDRASQAPNTTSFFKPSSSPLYSSPSSSLSSPLVDSSVGARHAVPERATSTHAPSTHNRATSGSESLAAPVTNGATPPSSFAGHGSAVPLRTDSSASSNVTQPHQTVITYREYVTHRTAPRDLAHEIIARSLARDDADGSCTAGLRPAYLTSSLGVSSPYTQNQSSKTPAGGQRYENLTSPYAHASHSHSSLGSSSPYSGAGTPACVPSSHHNPYDLGANATSHATSHSISHARNEKIDAIYLSPDAFARRTDEASIADQMGDVFAAAGFPRPIPADNDRIGGWILMYQMLDAGEWLLTDNCIELIRTIPTLVRDMARIEDIEKMDGDDPADAARYGLKSRYATRAAYSTERLPYEARLAARVLSADPTVRAIQARKAQLEEHRRTRFIPRRGR